MHAVVLDTNVIIAAIRSRRGASFTILSDIGKTWIPLISVPMILEYEAVAKRECEILNIPQQTADAIVRAFCFYGHEVAVYFRLTPTLRDMNDDFILELAVAGSGEAIVTHNVRHFQGAERFGVPVLTPGEFLRKMKTEGA